MKKFIILFSIIFTSALFLSSQDLILAESGDLCGGTGGNGQVVSVGNNEFILHLSRNNRDQVIHLNKNAEIKTSSGFISLPELKTGQSVTLVGGPNRDGSFTADNVFVCTVSSITSTPENGAGSPVPLFENRVNPGFKKVDQAIKIITFTLVGLIWINLMAFFRLKKKQSFTYLLFFTIFFIYFYKVLNYTLLQFQSLLLLRHFVPGLILNGVPAGRSLNLIPLLTLTLEDVKTSLLNILMMMPFGFGLPFITDYRFKKVVLSGFFVSLFIEFLQFATGFIANTTFRIADVNDLIFNTVGVAIGYILFIGFIRIYRYLITGVKVKSNSIWQYIADRPQTEN